MKDPSPVIGLPAEAQFIPNSLTELYPMGYAIAEHSPGVVMIHLQLQNGTIYRWLIGDWASWQVFKRKVSEYHWPGSGPNGGSGAVPE